MVRALSMALIITSLISVVANPDPAVMPQRASAFFERTVPMRLLLFSWYVAMERRRILSGYSSAMASLTNDYRGTLSNALTRSSSA